MLPLELTFQAIGSYPDKVYIPFEKIGKNNIFLISGATGSGKTTIFDAICYALFNNLSGSNRTHTTFRSHYAKSGIESYVEFKFLFKDEIYTVFRSLSYERNKLKGDGTIIEKGKAILTLPNSKQITGQKEVDSYIIDLLGLDIDRFSQIALLAQGEFLKLLNSDTQKRADIFRNIFKTTPYKDFELKLKDLTFKNKNEYILSKNSILQYLSQIILDDCDFKNEINNFIDKSEFILNDAFFDKFNRIIQIETDKKLSLDEKIKSNLIKISNLKTKLDKITQKEDLIRQKTELDIKIDDLKKQFEQIQNQYNSLENLQKQKENLKEEIKNDKENYTKALLAIEIMDKVNSANVLTKNLEFEFSNTNDKIKILKNTHINFLINNLEKSQSDYETETLKLKDFQVEFNLENKIYIDKYNLFISSQAGFLASNLKDNSPCPVCGATIHPNLAKFDVNLISQDEINNLKDNLDKKSAILNELSKKCSIINEKINFQKDKIELLKNQYKIDFNRINDDIDDINYIQTIENLEEKLNKTIENKTENDKKIIELNSKLKSLNIENTNYQTYIESYNKKEEILSNIELKIEKITKDYQEINLKLNTEISKSDLLKSQIEQLSDFDITLQDNLTNEISDIEAINKTDTKSSEELFLKIHSNKKIFEILKEKLAEFSLIEKDYINYKNLYDCASGQLKGKQRITFEQYIQGYYLDMVLYEANKRLKILSKGQYQLLRKQTSDNLQTKQGLDIEVMDFHTFKKRSTKTLSGGESFMTALCLALGLSDCAMSYTGGISIDSLFIDEGFGSLDLESLEIAFDVIFNLGLNNRLVGIISHVEELKSKIENKILTSKNQNGSKIEVLF